MLQHKLEQYDVVVVAAVDEIDETQYRVRSFVE